MAKSRKDSRGYVLRTGESQRKDGRYSYTDLDKNRRTVYAKTLVELRAKERKIIRDKEDGLNPQLADRMTLNKLYDRFIEQKYDLKPSTKVNYLYMYNHFVRPTFGKRLIGKIKYSDVKKFYYRIILDEEMKANTLDSIHTQLHPAFQMAVRDGLLRQNPTDGLMAEIKKSHIWEDNPRHALTIPQQKAFMDMSSYDEILLGFPIWWYVAPTIVNTFLEAYDFSGKKIVLFATSGGSGFGNTVKELQPSAPDAVITEGSLLNRGTKQEISEWVKSL